jgi:hypothetical protein
LKEFLNALCHQTVAEFLKHGFIVATFGAPTDRPAPNYLDDRFRKSNEHADDDPRMVVDALRERFGVPGCLAKWILRP